MNMYKNFLNISVIITLGIGINSAFAMGNEHSDKSADENTKQQCSPNKQSISATAKSPHLDQSYNCVPLASSEEIKKQGITTGKSPNKQNRYANKDRNPSNLLRSSSTLRWDNDFTDQRSNLFPSP